MDWRRRLIEFTQYLTVLGMVVGVGYSITADIETKYVIAIGIGLLLPLATGLIASGAKFKEIEEKVVSLTDETKALRKDVEGYANSLPEQIAVSSSQIGVSVLSSFTDRSSSGAIGKDQYTTLMGQIAKKVDGLQTGHFWESDPSQVHSFVRKLFEQVKGSAEVTSIVDIDSFWRAPEADRYLQSQKDVIKDGDRIFSRTFIFRELQEATSPSALACMREQAGLGIRVYVVVPLDGKPVPDELVKDFGIVDPDSTDPIAIFCEVERFSRRITRVDAYSSENVEEIEMARTLLAALEARRELLVEFEKRMGTLAAPEPVPRLAAAQAVSAALPPAVQNPEPPVVEKQADPVDEVGGREGDGDALDDSSGR